MKRAQMLIPQGALMPCFNARLVAQVVSKARTECRPMGVRREVAPRTYATLPDGCVTTDIPGAVAYDNTHR